MSTTAAVGLLAPARVKALLRGAEGGEDKVLVIDVRDSDFAGGHIRGAVNIAAETFCDDNRVDELVALCQGMDTVVLHCFLSQQRGPFCAQRLAERMEEAGGAHPEVCVMAGGWRRFRRELKEDDYDLVEDYVD
ncbi:hypothetical protein CHLNCDRAFT_142765 [Chlorella variabilis]|uniref:Rhodanese domain-containing protein n=1 Tax=Chlorella variabilis TaxID=554065 RepID=E1Z8P6_CHLVA|nr:hypothetical protein CHLNCDRAFT_142765 [Chlorella variabilis]EFN57375.1 hypothetical protein CHLNCDRAFT_142765 [Chlorella variabilis]|eukprot:XP_005849477.1 hypothetical protein CHLNCDRAFT_142765 [Chlorella variabilis]